MSPTSWSLEQLEDRTGEVEAGGEPSRPAASGDRAADPAEAAAGEDHDEGTTRLEEAEARIEELEERIEAEYRRGYEEGREDGRRETRAELEDEVEAAVASLADAASELEAELPGWERALEDNLRALAVAIARHVLGREVEADPGIVRERVREALDRFPADEAVTLRLHPRDLSLLREAAETTDLELGSGRDIEWRADGSLERGSCVADGPEHVVDGRTDRALLRVYKELSHG